LKFPRPKIWEINPYKFFPKEGPKTPIIAPKFFQGIKRRPFKEFKIGTSSKWKI